MANEDDGWIVLGGFFGRSNCGDEAMLQCIFETFQNLYEIAIIVDGHGAQNGFWDLYPYNQAKIINRSNIDFYANNNVKLLHIGGGGLSLGYLADHVIYAKQFGIKCALTGIEQFSDDLDSYSHCKSYLNLFDFFSYRNRYYSGTNSCGDWASNLVTDESDEISSIPNRVVLVIREHLDKDNLKHLFIKKYTSIIHNIILAGYFPVLTPFSPEDKIWIDKLGLSDLYPTFLSYTNPRRMQQLFKHSSLVLSAGRYHPLIFATNVDVCVAAISMESITREVDKKIRNACNYLSIKYLDKFNANEIHNLLNTKMNSEARKRSAEMLKSNIQILLKLIK